MSFNFLIQATRVLYNNKFDESELDLVYNFMIRVDNELLNMYLNNCSIISYNNDLELYLDIIDALINIYEQREEYERCEILLHKKEYSESIIEENKN